MRKLSGHFFILHSYFCLSSVVFLEGVGDVFEEDEAEDDVLVFRRVHVVTELVGGEPELGLEAEVGGGVGLGGCFGFGGHLVERVGCHWPRELLAMLQVVETAQDGKREDDFLKLALLESAIEQIGNRPEEADDVVEFGGFDHGRWAAFRKRVGDGKARSFPTSEFWRREAEERSRFNARRGRSFLKGAE